MSSTQPNTPDTLHAPPGLEHVDTAANLKALAALRLSENQSGADLNVTISVIPPTAGFNVTFDNEPDVDERLLHAKGKYALLPYFRRTPEADDEDNDSMLDVALLEDSASGFFLPPGLFEDEEEDESRLLEKLDMAERAVERRPCKAEHCLKGRAFALVDSFSEDENDHHQPNTLFSPMPSPTRSTRRMSSASSDTSSESTLITISTIDTEPNTFRSASPVSTHSSEPTRSSSRSAEKKPGHRHQDECVYFHASESRGVLLSDVKALRSGSLLMPEEEVLTSWGAPRCPTWIRVIINQHGYHKKCFFIPIRCYCSTTTRARLAYDLASLLELYFTTGTIRPGFVEDPRRRKDLSGLYLHSLRRNLHDETMVWRISVSDSPVSWTGKSRAR